MHLRPLLALLLPLALVACSRNTDDDPTPDNPTPPPRDSTVFTLPDTLTAGWSRTTGNFVSNLTDVYFTDSLRGYLSGDMGVFYSANGGRAWSRVNVPGTNTGTFVNIGAWNGTAVVADVTPELTRSSNGGTATRTAQATPAGSTAAFRDVFFTSATRSYAVSERYFWRSNDGGIRYDTLYNFGSPAFSNVTLYFVDSDRGWMTRQDGLYRTTDGGTSWTHVFNMGGNSGGLHFLPDGQTGFFSIGTFLFKTTDGGLTRTPIPLPGVNADQGGLADVYFFDAQNGYACAQNRVFRTNDGGATWTIVVRCAFPLVELHFTDPQHGWVCGTYGTLLRFQQP